MKGWARLLQNVAFPPWEFFAGLAIMFAVFIPLAFWIGTGWLWWVIAIPTGVLVTGLLDAHAIRRGR